MAASRESSMPSTARPTSEDSRRSVSACEASRDAASTSNARSTACEVACVIRPLSMDCTNFVHAMRQPTQVINHHAHHRTCKRASMRALPSPPPCASSPRSSSTTPRCTACHCCASLALADTISAAAALAARPGRAWCHHACTCATMMHVHTVSPPTCAEHAALQCRELCFEGGDGGQLPPQRRQFRAQLL